MARLSNEYAAFRRRLRRGREAAGLSQTEVAARLGKPQSYVSKCESGERRVDVIELLAFARIYGLPVQAFVEDTYTTATPQLRRVAESSAKSRKRR